MNDVHYMDVDEISIDRVSPVIDFRLLSIQR